jgi:hypothetical protein
MLAHEPLPGGRVEVGQRPGIRRGGTVDMRRTVSRASSGRRSHKRWLAVVLGAILSPAVCLASPQSDANEKRNWTLGLFVGYEYRSFDTVVYEHETHPQDASFLTGSPGSTEIDDGHFLAMGLRGEIRSLFGVPLEIFADVGFLASGTRDEHQNDNDPRPPENGSFVYSKLDPCGAEVAVGAQYRLFGNRLGIGGEGNWAWIPVEHGWDRFGEDEKADSEALSLFSAGPKLSYRASDWAALEVSYLFGLGKQSEQVVAVEFVFTWPR